MTRIFRSGVSRTKALVFLGLLLAAVVVPPFLSPFPLSVLMLIVIFAILAMSLDLLMGYTGMESLGQAAFFGMAAYTVAILSTKYDVGWQLAIPIALLASIVLAAIGAALAVRMTGLFFLVMTLVFSQVLWGLSHRWGTMTGGYLGLHGIERPFAFLDSELTFYYVILGVFLISSLLMYRLVRSPFGLTLRGVKDSELRMRTSGYNVWWHKFIVFVIAGAFAGVSGVLYTYSTQFISPTVLGVETSFEAMLMVIIGGAGTLTGPLIGAAVVTGLRNYLSVFFESWLIILGLGYIITVFFAPRGILGLLPRRWRAASGVGQEPAAAEDTIDRSSDSRDSSRVDLAVGGTLDAREERGRQDGDPPSRGSGQDIRSRPCRARRLIDGVLGHPEGDPGTKWRREDHLVQPDHRRLQAFRG